MSNVALKCSCGAVRGVARKVSPKSGTRLVCYCDDCQAFARFLGRDDVLDENGGTDIFQLTPAQIRITSGEDLINCMRLSSKGTYRWYTDCCKTPIGNTVSAGVPFVGLIHSFMGDRETRDRDLGPVRYFVQGQYATGTPGASKIHNKFPLTLVAKTLLRLLIARIRGRHRPTPFYDGSGHPIATPFIHNRESVGPAS